MNGRAILTIPDKLEREWDRDLFGKNGLATLLGWESHWTFRSKGSRAGFPDRTLARDRIIFAELKRDLTGKKAEDRARQPSPEQIQWLDWLAKAGAEVYLWRPADLDEIALILAAHHRPDWPCKSAWIPGVGRADAAPDPTRPPPPAPDYQGRIPGGARHENPAPIPTFVPPGGRP